MDELKSSVSVKQETNVFHQISLKNRAISDIHPEYLIIRTNPQSWKNLCGRE